MINKDVSKSLARKTEMGFSSGAGTTHRLVLESDEIIRLGSTDGELLRFSLGVDDGYTLGLNKGIDLGYFFIP